MWGWKEPWEEGEVGEGGDLGVGEDGGFAEYGKAGGGRSVSGLDLLWRRMRWWRSRERYEGDEMRTYKPTVSRRKLSKLETKNISA